MLEALNPGAVGRFASRRAGALFDTWFAKGLFSPPAR
jgi:hypothetical protein